MVGATDTVATASSEDAAATVSASLSASLNTPERETVCVPLSLTMVASPIAPDTVGASWGALTVTVWGVAQLPDEPAVKVSASGATVTAFLSQTAPGSPYWPKNCVLTRETAMSEPGRR